MKKTFISFKNAPKITSRHLGLRNFKNVAYKSDAADSDDDADDEGDVVVKSIKELGKKQRQQLTETKGELTTSIEKVKTELSTEVGEVKASVGIVKDEVDGLKTEVTEIKKKAGKLSLNGGNEQQKSFNDILAETIEANIEEIKNHKKGHGSMSFRLKGFEDEKIKEVKAVGDMSTSANVTNPENWVVDRRMSPLIETPYNRTWLADIIPNGASAGGSSVLFPKENGGEGAAALWTDPTADKAQMDFDLTTQQAFYKWIAGYVIVAREMLDDIPFMLSYIQNKMLISLKTAENDFILNGSTDTNPVSGILDLATAYDGSYTVPVERIIDAAWGQIVEDTHDFYNPTHVILQPRDAVAIGLNTASGSGEYDLPPGSVGFVNGNLTIGGLNTVKVTTGVAANNFVTFDSRALMFIRRMQPELRLFEDSTLAKKNKVMFRIEERATLIGFNNAAIVKGLLTPP